MREIIYYSKKAKTSHYLKQERLDILHRILLNTFFVSYNLRKNIKLHFIFYGPNNPPIHIEIESQAKIPLMQNEFSALLNEILKGCKDRNKKQIRKGIFVEKKSLLRVIDELSKEKQVYILSKKGRKIEKKIDENSAFLLGEIPWKELKILKKNLATISLGKVEYLTSQAVTIINYLLDIL